MRPAAPVLRSASMSVAGAERHVQSAAGRGGQHAVGGPPVRAAQHQPVRHLALGGGELLTVDLEDELGVQRGPQAQVQAAGDLGKHHDLIGRAVDVEAIRRQRAQPRPERVAGRAVSRRHVQRRRPDLDGVGVGPGIGIGAGVDTSARVGAGAGIGAGADQRLRESASRLRPDDDSVEAPPTGSATGSDSLSFSRYRTGLSDSTRTR